MRKKAERRKFWLIHLIWGCAFVGLLVGAIVCYGPAIDAALDAQQRAGEAEVKLLELEMRLDLERMDLYYMQGNDLRLIAGLERENSLYEALLSSMPREMVETAYNMKIAGMGGGYDPAVGGAQEQFVLKVLEPLPTMTTTNIAVQTQVEGLGDTEVAYLNYLDYQRLGNAVLMFPQFPDVSFVAQPDTYNIIRRGEVGIVSWKSDDEDQDKLYQSRWTWDGSDVVGIVYAEPAVLVD